MKAKIVKAACFCLILFLLTLMLMSVISIRRGDSMDENSGIKATDNHTEQVFYFYTNIQSDVENAMTLMGYGCRDYNLSHFYDRPQPMDVWEGK